MLELAPYLKQKIGSHLSYPVKFSELCEALAPAVEQLAIVVWFWDSRPPRQNEHREDYQVLRAEYSPRSPRNVEPEWRIFIAPIPRPLRETIHDLLLPLFAGRVRSWLLAERASGWYSTYHALKVRYVAATEVLEIDEHNAP